MLATSAVAEELPTAYYLSKKPRGMGAPAPPRLLFQSWSLCTEPSRCWGGGSHLSRRSGPCGAQTTASTGSKAESAREMEPPDPLCLLTPGSVYSRLSPALCTQAAPQLCVLRPPSSHSPGLSKTQPSCTQNRGAAPGLRSRVVEGRGEQHGPAPTQCGPLEDGPSSCDTGQEGRLPG